MSVPSLTLLLAALCATTIIVRPGAEATSNVAAPVWCSPPEQFYCYDSDTCKPGYIRCDGTPQCENDEDEEGCPECTEENAAELNKFYCKESDTCIYSGWKCDGSPDCYDGEDELDCPSGEDASCPADRFSCGDGQCIDELWRCDKQPDCQNGADEENCEPTCAADELACTPAGAEGHFSAMECIPPQWLCDGADDCLNGEDEVGCGVKECAADRFNCSSENACMPRNWMCDGDKDCDSGEDEADCPSEEESPTNTRLCTDLEFKCVSGHIPCIIKAWKCDKQDDCADGSDEGEECPNYELKCNSAEFKCEDGSRCIPRFLVCSGAEECEDGSDERQAECPPVHCDIDNDQFACDESNFQSDFCLTLDKICDGEVDCANQRDERDEICGDDAISNPCLYSDSKCGVDPHIVCTNVKTNLESNENRTVGYKCGCETGYNYHDMSCHDKNECQNKENPVCDQICSNELGSYKCDCLEGYVLSTDNRSCLVDPLSVHPRLLFTNRHQIRAIHIHGQGEYMPLIDSKAAVALDFDYSTKEVFYSDMDKKKLFKFKLPAPDSEDDLTEVDLKIPGVQTPDGLAYDWIYKHLYWTDTSSNTINMACIDGDKEHRNPKVIYQNANPNCTDLSADEQGINVCLDEPRALAVHPRKGWVFWSDWGNKPHIVLAALDGSHKEMIAYNLKSDKQYLYWPNGLTLDLSSDTERLYWIDALLHSVFSCTIDRCITDIDVLVYNTDKITHPFSITVFENKLYWSDWTQKHIVSANKYTGKDIKTLLNGLEQPMDLKVYHPMSQQQSTNHCEVPEGDEPLCEQICVPKPWSRPAASGTLTLEDFSPVSGKDKYSCLCSDGYTLNSDSRTCEKIVILSQPSATRELTGQSDSQSQVSVGTIAAIASSCVLLLSMVVGVAVFLVLRRVRLNKSKDMNFDNPVYKRTTEDKLELPRHEYQPSHTDPTASVPLTSSEGTSDAQGDYNV